MCYAKLGFFSGGPLTFTGNELEQSANKYWAPEGANACKAHTLVASLPKVAL